MVVDSRRRDPVGFFADTEQRIVALERRNARGLPPRLQSAGAEVTDWNDATQPGFYWSKTGALNSPTDNDFQSGLVTIDGNGRVVQTVVDARTTTYAATKRRMGYPSGASITWGAWVDLTTPWASIPNKPAGFSDVPPTVADLNTVIGPGWVTANGTTANRPDSSLWFVVETTNSGGRATQFARTIDRTGVMYKRWLGVPGDTTSWTAWVAVGNETIEDWTDLRPYLGAGMAYSAETNSTLAGLRARRVGLYVEMVLANFSVNSMSVPISGNIANQTLFSNLPTRFRPSLAATIQPGWAGRGWAGYVMFDGTAMVASVTPTAGKTANETMTNEVLSGYAFYPAGTP